MITPHSKHKVIPPHSKSYKRKASVALVVVSLTLVGIILYIRNRKSPESKSFEVKTDDEFPYSNNFRNVERLKKGDLTLQEEARRKSRIKKEINNLRDSYSLYTVKEYALKIHDLVEALENILTLRSSPDTKTLELLLEYRELKHREYLLGPMWGVNYSHEKRRMRNTLLNKREMPRTWKEARVKCLKHFEQKILPEIEGFLTKEGIMIGQWKSIARALRTRSLPNLHR